MDLTFPTVDGGAGPQLYEPAAWAFVGVGAESLAFIESLVDLGHRRVVALVDEMLPAARVSLPGRWVCRLHGDDGVLQGLQPTLEEARDSILQLVMGDGGPAAELFIVMDDGAVSEGSALVAALSDLSSELRGQEETAAVRLHGIITMDSAVTPDVRETLAAIMSAGWLCTVLLIPSERYASPQPSGSPLPAASIVDLLSWLPRMAAADGGFSEPALRSHLKTSGLSTVALLGSSDTSEGACRQIASTILGSGSICDGLAPATARSAVVVGFVGQQDLNTDPELMDRARAALAAIGQQVPQARVNQGLYVVETPGVRVLVALFGLA
jgi:hypothetical protein